MRPPFSPAARFGLASLLAAGALALAPAGPSLASTSDPSASFRVDRIDTGNRSVEAVFSGFFSPGHARNPARAELVTVTRTAAGERLLHLHAFDGANWQAGPGLRLPDDTSFIDSVSRGDHDQILVASPSGLAWLDTGSGALSALVSIPTRAALAADGTFAHVDISHDLNGDGRDELVVPGRDGISVFVQQGGGDFLPPLTLGPAFDPARYGLTDSRRLDPWAISRVHCADIDLDGRADLVVAAGNDLIYHRQEVDGRFAAYPTRLDTGLAFDGDDMAALAAPHGIRNRLSDRDVDGEMNGRVLHTIADLDGDGLVDLGIFTLGGGGLMSLRAGYEIHRGERIADGTLRFIPPSGTAISTRGLLFDLIRSDINDDGRADLVFVSMKMNPFGILGGLITRTVTLDVETFLHDDTGDRQRPDGIWPLIMAGLGESGDSGARAATLPPLLIADLDGDGRKDLITGRHQHAMQIYRGVADGEVFAHRAERLPVASPGDGVDAWTFALDRSGRTGLIAINTDDDGDYVVTLQSER